MKKTRLFHSLVVLGASLTGGAIATAATVTIAATVSGCGDDTTNGAPLDLSFPHYPDIGIATLDMSTPPDLTPHD